MLFTLLAAALAASDPSIKILESIAGGRPDKAWESCQKLLEKGPLTDTALRAACATADLENTIMVAIPSTPDRQIDLAWSSVFSVQ